MSLAQSEQTAEWVEEAAAPPVEHPQPFWRSLHFFNAYRLFLAVFLLAIVTVWGDSLQFASRNLTLFGVTAVLYVLFSAVCFALVRMKWRFNLQITVQAVADIAFIVVLMHASGGISSGLGLLLLATLAAVGLISRGRLALFHAALASIAVLLEHTYSVLRFDASVAQLYRPACSRWVILRQRGSLMRSLSTPRQASGWRHSARSISPTWRRSISS